MFYYWFYDYDFFNRSKKYFLIMKNLICFLCVFYRMLFWKELNLLLSYFYLFKGNNRYLLKNRKGFVEWIV